jgi:hypothetical protein
MRTKKQIEKKRLKKLNKRKAFLRHKNLHPKDTVRYKAYKAMQSEVIGKMQADNEKKLKEEAKLSNKVKKFFSPFINKNKARTNSARGK